MQVHEDRQPGIRLADIQDPGTSMMDKLTADHDQVGNNLAKAFAKRWSIRIELDRHERPRTERRLANPAERIEGHHGHGEHKGIDAHLAGRQPFNAKIAFQLTVKLLRSAVIVVESNDSFRGFIHIGPPGFKIGFRNQEGLALLVDGSLGELEDKIQHKRICASLGMLLRDRTSPDRGTGKGRRHGAEYFGVRRPYLAIFSSQVMLDDEKAMLS